MFMKKIHIRSRNECRYHNTVGLVEVHQSNSYPNLKQTNVIRKILVQITQSN